MIKVVLILIMFFIGSVSSNELDDLEACTNISSPVNQETCNSITDDFSIPGFKCCFIKAKVDGVEGKGCARIKDNEFAIEIIIQSLQNKHGKGISIECYSIYLIKSSIIALLLLF